MWTDKTKYKFIIQIKTYFLLLEAQNIFTTKF